MNKIYRLKFNRCRNELVVVGELTTGAGKPESGTRLLSGKLSLLAALSTLILGILPTIGLSTPYLLPTGGDIVAGQGDISSSGNQMTVNQNSQNIVANWNSFDIGKNHTVRFIQPDSSAAVLNRVTGGYESQILGTLQANGQVFLINPNGIFFGGKAKVNTAGFIASTKNINDMDFMKGGRTFNGGSVAGAQVINQGSLIATKGGFIVLAADQIKNSGTITAPSGKLRLAAVETVTLQLDGQGLISVTTNGSVVNALVENSGLIAATDGQVWLTVKGRDMLLSTVLNNTGTINAMGLSKRGGNIILDSGDTGVLTQSGTLLADGHTIGGKITLEGENIHLTGNSKTLATGKAGGGEVHVGGGWQSKNSTLHNVSYVGSGWQSKNSTLRNVSKIVMDKKAFIDVSAIENGSAGTAVLWSQNYTAFNGNIRAQGGILGGNGGRVETSSYNNLQAFGNVDISARYGHSGDWVLLEPIDVTIVGSGSDINISHVTTNYGTDIFSPIATDSQILNSSISNQLNNGINVTIQTSGMNAAKQPGNITVNADISKTLGGNASLTLKADGNITVTDHAITSTNGALDVHLLASASDSGRVMLANSTISTCGGDITVTQLQHTTTAGIGSNNPASDIHINKSVLNAGNVTLSGINVADTIINAEKDIRLTGMGNSGDESQVRLNEGNNLTKSIVSNISVNADGDISPKGSGLTNSTVTMTNGSLSIDNNGTTFLTGTNITAHNGGVIIHSGTGIIDLTNGNISAKSDINLTADNGGINIAGADMSTQAHITSIKGNIVIAGNGKKSIGVNLINANLTSVNMNINGNTEGLEESRTDYGNEKFGGIRLFGAVNFHVQNNGLGIITGYANNKDNAGVTVGLSIGQSWNKNTNILFDGDFNVKGIADRSETNPAWGGGIFFNTAAATATLTFTGKTILSGEGKNALGGVSGSYSAYSFSEKQSFILKNGANLVINLTSDKGGGMNAAPSSDHQDQFSEGYDFSGEGSVQINAHTNSSMAAAVISLFNNTNLTGSFALNAINDSGDAVVFPGYTTINLVNATITGTSQTGAGIRIEPNHHIDAKVNLSNNTLNGISSSGNGVLITGDKITITNGTLKGLATSGEGGGVVLNGGNNYTIDGASVFGQSVNGTGVVVGGTLTLNNNASLSGEATGTGDGVTINGTFISDSAVTISGNAITGSGVRVSGDTKLNHATVSGKSVSGSGVNIAGNLINENTSITGSATGSGTAVEITGNITGGSLYGNSATGTGVQVSGSKITVTDITITGKTDIGKGLSISGNAFNAGSTTLTSTATGSGTAVEINGNITGGSLYGNSAAGTGVQVSGSKITVTDITITGKTDIGKGLSISGNAINAAGSTILTSTATGSGTAVEITGNITGGFLYGNSAAGTGVQVSGNKITVTDITITGKTDIGKGLSISGNAFNAGSTILTSTATGSGTAVEITGNITGGSLYGDSAAGTGVQVSGDTQLKHITVSGKSVSGRGVNVTGNLINENTSITGSATGSGTAVEITGNITGGSLYGNSAAGTGVQVSGSKITVTDITITGKTDIGKGLSISGNAFNVGNTTLTSTATGSGTAVEITGNITGGSLYGDSAAGTGVQVSGDTQLKHITVSGKSVSGRGVNVAGNLINENTSITGSATGSGTAVEITGNITGGSLYGDSAAGTGVQVSGSKIAVTDINITGKTDIGKGLSISGNAFNVGNTTLTSTATGSGTAVEITGNITGGSLYGDSAAGTGVQVSGNKITVTDITITGKTDIGKGLSISGNAFNAGSTILTSTATGSGTAVEITGNITGGTVIGSSKSGNGVQVTGNSTLHSVTVSGVTTDGIGLNVHDGKLNITPDNRINASVTEGGNGARFVGDENIKVILIKTIYALATDTLSKEAMFRQIAYTPQAISVKVLICLDEDQKCKIFHMKY